MPDNDTRLYTVEQDIKNIFDRLGKVEDKASGAWKTISEVNSRMDKVEQKVDALERGLKALDGKVTSMEVDMKEQKVTSGDMKRMLKVLIAMVAVMGVISLGFFLYIWRHDADLANSIIKLGATVAGAVV